VLATVAGWGATSEGGAGSDRLKEVALPIVSDAQCAAHYGSSTVAATEVCAGYPEGGQDSCQGDSGGPFMVRNGGSWLLAGIVSWGDGCARPGVPGVYAEVGALASFIDSHKGPSGSGAAAQSAPVLFPASPALAGAPAELTDPTPVNGPNPNLLLSLGQPVRRLI